MWLPCVVAIVLVLVFGDCVGECDSGCDCESDWHPDCSGYYGMCVLKALRLGLWMIGRPCDSARPRECVCCVSLHMKFDRGWIANFMQVVLLYGVLQQRLRVVVHVNVRALARVLVRVFWNKHRRVHWSWRLHMCLRMCFYT